MKEFLIVFVTSLILSIPVHAKHRALLVGVGDYPSASGWQKINSANDVSLLAPAMQRRGFVVTTLLDNKATKTGIVAAIKRLTSQSGSGDCVWLHFSGHGQQVEDHNGDEPDGLDEAFVCYDAHRYYSKTYRGQNHLLDDELNPLLVALRKRLGAKGKLLVTIDACHSGDSYRASGDNVVTDTLVGLRRGVNDVLAKHSPYVRRKPSSPMRLTPLKRSQGYAAVALLAACQPNECNYEYIEPGSKRSYGALSYMLWEAMNASMRRSDVMAIAHWVMKYNTAYMRKYQHPHLFEE